MHSLRTKQMLMSTAIITAAWLFTTTVSAQILYEVKPRILIVFDTSGSMAFNFDGDNTQGDGTYELWDSGDNTYCCPGTANGGGQSSRMYAAKEAMTQMLNASGEIEFALLKFAQVYSTTQPTSGYDSNQYRGNQSTDWWVYDKLRYDGLAAGATFDDWRRFLAVGFGDYLTPGTTDLTLWRDVNTENNRAEIAMWMNHHEYGNGTKEADASQFSGPYNDYREQELRADGGTPLAEALVEARAYLNNLRDSATGLDDYRHCRKYTVLILTDGAANTDPVSEVTDLYNDGVESWVIGLAYSSSTLNSMADAGGDHYDPNNWGSAFTANSQEALAAALFYIVSESLAFEDCNYKDDDCDGIIDEGVIGQYCDVHNVLNTRDDTDTGWIEVVYDTDSTTDTEIQYNPNYPLTCTDPGESVCDGIDDNCDGSIDEAPVDGEWDTSEDPDFGQSCIDTDAPAYLQTQLSDSDAVLAPCAAGIWACIPGGDGKTCVNYIGPNAEQCDGVDNDCDGLIDEASATDTDNFGLEGDTCGNSQGICDPGIYTCVDTGWTCVGGTVGTDETCNGSDDNCNGEVDETYPEAGSLCYDAGDGGCDTDGTNCDGICQAGVRACVGGSLTCSGVVGGDSDDSVCNGLDDDCDGGVDEDAIEGAVCPSGADSWTIGGASICNRGTMQCQGSAGMVCVGDGGTDIVRPGVEVCDGIDNDCDGSVDEGLYGSCGGCVVGVDTDFDCIDTDPGAGECRVGIGECDSANSTPGNPIYTNCNDQGPVAEECNGKDDDCDGSVDETADLSDATLGDICYPNGLSGCDDPDPDTGGTCEGECEYGQIACVSGALGCLGYTDPESEGTVCDNLDNNCNGQVDEGITNDCGTIDTDAFPGASFEQGECSYGVQYCSPATDGEDPATWGACEGARGPVAELCNGLDDDCDGIFEDEEAADLAANSATSYVGEDCGSCDGIYECVRDTAVTLGEMGAYELVCAGGDVAAEVCNGLDENCNDVVDDGIAPVACGGCEWGVDTDWDCINGQPDAGECQLGYDYCIDGAMSTECYGSVGPVAEICDGLDNDCDGESDEDFEEEVICQEAVGECPQGILKCAELDGELGLHCCDADVWETLGSCEIPTLSQIEICDGLDNDCDGQIDEDIAQVGQPCGSYLGVCEPGVYQCVETENTEAPAVNGFEVICVGGTTGSVEECNNLDDDCDGAVDEDIPAGDVCTKAPNWMADPALQAANPEGIGECPVGNEVCVAGNWVCNVAGPTDEVCDGLDNDCDGLVDEDEEVECPLAGSICIEGSCAEPCGDGEFECPGGKACIDVGNGEKVCMTTLCDSTKPEALPCVFNDSFCTPGQGFEPPCTCDPLSGMCVDVCYNKSCSEGSVCVAADNGRCHQTTEGCMVTGCDDGQKCVSIDMCAEEPCQQCVTDPCADVTCEDGQYCNAAGTCVNTCEDVICPAGQGCKDGVCVADDPCAGIICSTGVLCNETTGKCDASLPNPCQGVVCEFYENCEDGVCVFDSCMNVECPNGTVCKDGSCYESGGFVAGNDATDTDTTNGTTDTADTDTTEDSAVDSSVTGQDSASAPQPVDTGAAAPTNYEGLDRVLATGTGGCMCATAPGADTPDRNGGLLLLLIGGLLMVRMSDAQRRKKLLRIIVTFGAVLMLVLLAGCQVDPFEFAGANDSAGASNISGSGGAGTDDTSSSTSTATDSDSGATDGGTSGNGTDPGDSASGGTDVGCSACSTDETCCTNAAGVEFCADLSSNPSHCGACNQLCSKPHASASCVEGVCTFLACETYWHDINSSDTDGCEYYCKPTADQDDNADICDGAASSADPENDDYVPLDNDCDFDFDEDVDFMNDPNNCGFCGNVCLFNHATAQCVNGECAMGACDAKWYDRANGSADGCEYYCAGSAETVEVCDFQDNDCDGEVDESDPSEGAACYPEGSSGCSAPYGDTDCKGICQAGVMSCSEGTLRCTGYQLATLEICDGVDNNCNGLTDEGLSISCGGGSGADPGAGVCQTGLAACIAESAGVADVYDTDNCRGSVSPGVEICDGADNDCDGLTDELAAEDGNSNNIETNDARLGVACGLGACAAYLTKCISGDIGCDSYTVPASDVPCNGIDDDCDGIVDEIDSYLCGGSNGYPCNDTAGCDAYSEGVCQAGTFSCSDTDIVCVGDAGPSVADTDHLDICDNLDNDCDGLVDEDAFYSDTDSDRSCGSPCNDGTLACVNGTLVCNGETTPTPDLCDTAGADEDCNPATVNGAGEANFMQSCDGTDAGDCEEGYWECGPSGMFCNEADGDDIEVCDGIDNDCDGLVDGADTDMVVMTVGDLGCDDCPGTELAVCAGSSGWQCRYDDTAGVDCGADTDCYSHATVESACDGIDNDCDGVVDDNFQLQTNISHCGVCGNDCTALIPDTGDTDTLHVAEYYCSSGNCRVKTCDGTNEYYNLNGVDTDGCECQVNHAACDTDSACDKCSNGSLLDVDDDCDGVADENASAETCNGVDDDCDGDIDEGLTYPGYCEALCDAAYSGEASCVGGEWVCDYTCDTAGTSDTDAGLECAGDPLAPSPSTPEAVCDGIDGNCDGSVDESFALGGSCSNSSLSPVGGCLRYGKMLCSESGGTVCCDLSQQTSGVCLAENEINMSDPLAHAEPEELPIPNGIDDDCDGEVDEEATGAIDYVTVPYVNGAATDLYFDMFKYEASRGDATAADAGVVSTAACSQSGVMPWTYVNYSEAQAACDLLNASDCATDGLGCWQLCSVTQWEHACSMATGSTTYYPYANVYEAATCNGLDYGNSDTADTDSDGLYGVGPRPAAFMSACSADWPAVGSGSANVMDLSGNVEEWTGTANTLGTGATLYSIRGGSFNDLASGLRCDFDFSAADGSSSSYRLENLGFRCCRTDLSCTGDSECPDYFYCDTDNQCKEANDDNHCGDGSTVCASDERCAGSMEGCVSCTSDEFCGDGCVACDPGEHCNGSSCS